MYDALTILCFLTYANSIQNLQEQCARVVDPLLYSIRREFAAIIATLHKLDFGKSNSASAGMMSGGGASVYMEELVAKLSFVKTEILENYAAIDVSRRWLVSSYYPPTLVLTNTSSSRVISIVKYVIRTFVLHVSIAKPLGESGKLQLTSDMAELEFALSSFMANSTHSNRQSGGDWTSVTEDYRSLRAMRSVFPRWPT